MLRRLLSKIGLLILKELEVLCETGALAFSMQFSILPSLSGTCCFPNVYLIGHPKLAIKSIQLLFRMVAKYGITNCY